MEKPVPRTLFDEFLGESTDESAKQPKAKVLSTCELMQKFPDEQTVNHSAKKFVDGMAHTNSIESIWASLKRGFYGIYHSFSKKHLALYVDEFVFRLNEGNCKIDTVDRLESLVRGVAGKRLTYKMLIQKI